MPWVRIDDGFVDHPKIARVGAMGAWLQLQALCYANRNLTDGFVPQDVAEAFAARGVLYVDEKRRRWKLGQTCGVVGRYVTEVDWPAVMVDAGLWEEVPGGYRIHDFDRYQPSRQQVLSERHRVAESMRSLRAQRRGKAESTSQLRGVLHRNMPVSYTTPVPVPLKRDPDARARALQSGGRARAEPQTQTGAPPRRGIARAAPGPPRGGPPLRLGDLLAAALAARARAP